MKKKKMVFIGIVIFLIGLGITGSGLYLSMHKEEKEKKVNVKQNTLTPDDFGIFSLTNKKKLEVCQTKDNCDRLDAIFSQINYEGKNTIINQLITTINDKTEQYYNQMKNSTLEDASCINVKEKYKYSILPTTQYNLFENENYISIAITREIRNLCNETTETVPLESYFYDKKAGKLIEPSERVVLLNISDEKVYTVIEQSYREREKLEGVNRNIEELKVNGKIEYTLYYSTEGTLLAAYLEKDELGTRYMEVNLT